MSERLYKRGRIWWGWYYAITGELVRVSLRTTSKAIARKKLRSIEALAADPAAHQAAQSLEECMTYFVDTACATKAEGTRHSYGNKARHLLRLLGEDTPTTEIDRTVVEDYYTERLAEGASTRSLHKESVVLRSALRTARERGLWSGDERQVVPSVKVKYQPRRRWLTRAEYDAIIATAPEHRRMFIALGCLAGLNFGELHRLQWSDVDLHGGWLQVPGTKRASRWRRVPIGVELREILEVAAGTVSRPSSGGSAFTKTGARGRKSQCRTGGAKPNERAREEPGRRYGAPVPDPAATPSRCNSGPPPSNLVIGHPWLNNCRRDLAAICTRTHAPGCSVPGPRRVPKQGNPCCAGVEPVTSNDLRRTFASWLKQRGVDSLVVAHLMGHTTTRMVELVYGRLAEETYRDAVALLPRKGLKVVK